jgi:hypothetical protein
VPTPVTGWILCEVGNSLSSHQYRGRRTREEVGVGSTYLLVQELLQLRSPASVVDTRRNGFANQLIETDRLGLVNILA